MNVSRAEEVMLNWARVQLGGGYLDGQREGSAVLDKAPITSLGKQSGAAHQLLYVETPSAPARGQPALKHEQGCSPQFAHSLMPCPHTHG